MHFVASVAN